MPTDPSQSSNPDDIVEHKVKRRVAKKVLKDIHAQVDDIEQQVETENQAGRLLVPSLLILLLIVLTMLFWPEILRLVSVLIKPD